MSAGALLHFNGKPFIPRLIGICGQMGSGKTTLSNILVNDYDFSELSFAEPLKAALLAMGVPLRFLHGTQAQKETPLPMLGGRSARYAMQTLGTEWGRETIHPDLWVLLAEHRLQKEPDVQWVVPDVRFPNEVDMIHRNGGTVVRIVRGPEKAPAHKSEDVSLLKSDYVIVNNGDMSALRTTVAEAFQAIRKEIA